METKNVTTREMVHSLEDWIYNQETKTGTKLLSCGNSVRDTTNGTFEIVVQLDGRGIGEIELTADQALHLALELTNSVRCHGLETKTKK